jgi:tellurite resistance protein TerC
MPAPLLIALSRTASASGPAPSNAVASADSIAAHFPPVTVAIFLAIFAFSLVMDLAQHKDHKEVTVRNAAGWSIFWIALSLGFWGWLRTYHAVDHPEWASAFLTGYVLEKTLSIDNLMVFIAIFKFFDIRSGLQHRILYFGILGAIVFRAIFVGIGAGLLTAFGPYAEVLFGLFVVYAAVMMLRGDNDGDGEPDYSSMGIVRMAKRLFPVFPRLVGVKFFVDRDEAEAIAREDGSIRLETGVQRWMTPAFVCLLVIEGSDVLFAVDSVPAVIAVSREPLIVYTAMIFAVLGLRSLYFIVEALTKYLCHLEKAVIAVLFFIGLKMFVGAAAHWGITLPWWSTLSTGAQANYSLVVVLATLAVGIVASLVFPEEEA